MSRQISQMSAELASWALNYRTRDQDIFGARRYGRHEDRAAVLDHVVSWLDDAAEQLARLPRMS